MEPQIDKLAENPVALFYLALIALALILVGLVIFFFKLRKTNLLVFKNENGRVEISKAAIQEIVRRTCERFVEVGRARSNLSQSKGYIYIEVRLKLRIKTRLQDISNQLQKQITRAIRDDLGIENLAVVNVVVEGFISTQLTPKD